MTLAAELSELSAAALLSAYRDRRLSPVEVVEASLVRIERADRLLDAFCLVDPERARAEARRSEQRWRDGAPAGALDGIPVAVKDVFPTRGWPTLRGSRAIDPAGPWEEDASAVAALRRRIERRQLRGARGRDGAARPRDRRRRIDPDPVQLLRAARDQAHVRPGPRVAPQPVRHGGPRGPDGPLGHRSRASARRDVRARPARLDRAAAARAQL